MITASTKRVMWIPYIFANSTYGNKIFPQVLEPELFDIDGNIVPRDEKKKWLPVVGTVCDAKLVKQFLFEWTNFKRIDPENYLVDESTENIKMAFEGLRRMCRQFGQAGTKGHDAPIVIFLFIAGHGFTFKGEQFWVLNSGESINIEDKVR